MTDRTHPDSGELDGPGIVPELRVEIERLRAELIAAKADADLTRCELRESRADEMQAMAYLNEIRDVIGGIDYEHTVKIAHGLKRLVDAMEGQEPVAWVHPESLKAQEPALMVSTQKLGSGQVALFAHPVPSVPDELINAIRENVRIFRFGDTKLFAHVLLDEQCDDPQWQEVMIIQNLSNETVDWVLAAAKEES